MKKENLLLSIGFGVMILVSTVLLVIYQNFIPTTKIDKLFGQKVVLSDEVYIKEGNIVYKQNVKSKFNKELGTLYFTETKNVFGSIELYIVIDSNQKVLVIDKKIDQTESYVKQVREYILRNYQGIYYENVQFIDGAAGATTIGTSRNTVKQTVSEVINFHYGMTDDYITDLLGEDSEITGDVTLLKNDVMQFKAKDKNGTEYTVYRHTKKGKYTNAAEDSITVMIALDNNHIIQKVAMPDGLYNHTKPGSFLDDAVAYLNSFIGKSIKAEIPEAAGATSIGTRPLIKLILEEIAEVIA